MSLTKQHTLSDVQLWEKLLSGDADAFTRLFKKYYAVHCAKAQYILRSAHDAEDLVQDIYKKLWENHSTLPPVAAPAAYISQAVRNGALNRIKGNDKNRHDDIAGKHIIYEEGISAEELLHLQNRIEKAVNELPEGCQAIFRLSRFELKTYAQIAEHLQITPKTVENQISIALKKLRQNLGDLIFIFLFYFILGVNRFLDVFNV